MVTANGHQPGDVYEVLADRAAGDDFETLLDRAAGDDIEVLPDRAAGDDIEALPDRASDLGARFRFAAGDEDLEAVHASSDSDDGFEGSAASAAGTGTASPDLTSPSVNLGAAFGRLPQLSGRELSDTLSRMDEQVLVANIGFTAPALLMPWTASAWVSMAMGLTPPPWLGSTLGPLGRPPLVVQRPLDVPAPVGGRAVLPGYLPSGPAHLRAIKKMKDLPWPDLEDSRRQRAVSRWRLLLETDPTAFDTGDSLLALLQDGAGGSELASVLRDLFASKSTSTLMKRAGSVFQYLSWCSRIACCSSFPITEAQGYDYLCYMRDAGCPATRAAGFVEAVAFLQAMLGLKGASPFLCSQRIRGSAFAQFTGKRALTQKPPLLVTHVLALEDLVRNAESVADRVASGYFLMMVYSRARFADLMSCEMLVEDYASSDPNEARGFIEARTRRTKTGTSKEKRTAFLPLTAPTHGLLAGSWARAWVHARDLAGLACGPQLPCLPAPTSSGGWQSRPTTAQEAIAWLRNLLLQNGTPSSELSELGTHSCKSTALSWCSKFGVAGDVRRFLGYHIAPGDGSMLTYSRDGQAQPLRALEEVVAAVRNGTFLPDSTRSGRFAGKVARTSAEAGCGAEAAAVLEGGFRAIGTGVENEWLLVPAAGKEKQPSDAAAASGQMELPSELAADTSCAKRARSGSSGPSSTASSKSSCTTCSASSDSDDLLLDEEAAGLTKDSPNSDLLVLGACRLAQHRDHGTVHVVRDEEPNRLTCGRLLHAGFLRLQSIPAFRWPRCQQCFGKQNSAACSSAGALIAVGPS